MPVSAQRSATASPLAQPRRASTLLTSDSGTSPRGKQPQDLRAELVVEWDLRARQQAHRQLAAGVAVAIGVGRLQRRELGWKTSMEATRVTCDPENLCTESILACWEHEESIFHKE